MFASKKISEWFGHKTIEPFCFWQSCMTNQLKMIFPKKCGNQSRKTSNIWTLLYLSWQSETVLTGCNYLECRQLKGNSRPYFAPWWQLPSTMWHHHGTLMHLTGTMWHFLGIVWHLPGKMWQKHMATLSQLFWACLEDEQKPGLLLDYPRRKIRQVYSCTVIKIPKALETSLLHKLQAQTLSDETPPGNRQNPPLH